MRALSLVLVVAACGRTETSVVTHSNDAGPVIAAHPSEWTRLSNVQGSTLATDDAGDVYVAGSDDETASVFVEKIEATTMHTLWHLGTRGLPQTQRHRPDFQEVTSIAVDGGSVYLTGYGVPGTTIRLGRSALSLPPLGGYWAAFVAKLDATNGTVDWLVSPDAHGAVLDGFSRGFGIAARDHHVAIVFGYYGDGFGLGPPYLDGEGLALVRIDDAPGGWTLRWQTRITGDLAYGLVGLDRRGVAIDGQGDIWVGGSASTEQPIVDETRGEVALAAGNGTPQTYDPYVLEFDDTTHALRGAHRWVTNEVLAGDCSLDLSNAGLLTTLVYGDEPALTRVVVFDTQTVEADWWLQQPMGPALGGRSKGNTFLVFEQRDAVSIGGVSLPARPNGSVQILKFDASGAVRQAHQVVDGYSGVRASLVDSSRSVIYVLGGVHHDDIRFDDGQLAGSQPYLLRRALF